MSKINRDELIFNRYLLFQSKRVLEILKKLDNSHGLRAVSFGIIRMKAGYIYKLRKEETNEALRLLEKQGKIVINKFGVYVIHDNSKPMKVLKQVSLSKWIGDNNNA